VTPSGSGEGSPGFTPPPYPYDRLATIKARSEERFKADGGLVDCSIGTPCDPPPRFVLEAMASSNTERGYPTSAGSPAYRQAAAGWLSRRFGVTVDPDRELAACVGTKEFVASTAQYLRLRTPGRDTVLYPAVSYPTYAMGAQLGGCRAVPVAERPDGGLELHSIDSADIDRALLLWANSPSNPSGALTDLVELAGWGRGHGIPVFSDECYAEFTWDGPPRTVLSSGVDGVVAVHSLSKRSNLAGVRAGFFAGDPELVGFLLDVRRHAGLMVPGPVQAGAVAAFDDDEHVAAQRERYRERLDVLSRVFDGIGLPTPLPAGGFYLWVPVPAEVEGGGWALAETLAMDGGVLVSPGDLYGPDGSEWRWSNGWTDSSWWESDSRAVTSPVPDVDRLLRAEPPSGPRGGPHDLSFWKRYSVGVGRRARRSPQTKANANAAATQASLFPIDRKLARLTTVSSESLASAAEFHRARSPASGDLAATTAPNPKTRSLMPIVLMSNTEAPVGSSLPDKRMGVFGATTSATPTNVRSHPIASLLTIGMAAAYPRHHCRDPWNHRSRGDPEPRVDGAYRLPSTGTSGFRASSAVLGCLSPVDKNTVVTTDSLVVGDRSERDSQGVHQVPHRHRADRCEMVRSGSSSPVHWIAPIR
jgi:aspartate/methionine/tyrosine aminotransferase